MQTQKTIQIFHMIWQWCILPYHIFSYWHWIQTDISLFHS